MTGRGTALGLAMATAVAAAATFVLLRPEGGDAPPGSGSEAGVEVPRLPPARLQGTGTPAAPMTVDEAHALLRASGYDDAARERLAEAAAADPRVLAAVVDRLRSDRVPNGTPPDQRARAAEAARRVLCEVLERVGSGAAEVIAALLTDPDPLLRRRAIACLGQLGPLAAGAVPALSAAFAATEDPRERAAILGALGLVGPAAAETLPLFAAAIRDERTPEDVRVAAAEGLLAVAGPTREAFDLARDALREQAYEVCTALLARVAELGPAGAPLHPDLLELAADRDAHEKVRELALDALTTDRPADERTIGALLDLVEDRREVRSVRAGAARAIGRLSDDSGGPGASPRAARVRVLVAVAIDADEADPVRAAAARALARLGPAGIDALARALAGADEETRILVGRGLAASAPAAAVFSILDPLRTSPEPGYRVMALRATREMVDLAARVAWLRGFLGDPGPDVRAAAVEEIADVWDEAGTAFVAVLEALRDRDVVVRRAALRGLLGRAAGGMGEDVDAARTDERGDAVVRLLGDPDPGLQVEAAQFLSFFAPSRAAETIPVWIDLLESPWLTERLHAAETLGRLGPVAASAVPALERALTGARDGSTREECAKALQAIRGK